MTPWMLAQSRVIARGKRIRDIRRLVETYGGKPVQGRCLFFELFKRYSESNSYEEGLRLPSLDDQSYTRRGKLYTYRLVPSIQRPRLDLGFGIVHAASFPGAEKAAPGDIVEVVQTASNESALYRLQPRAGTGETDAIDRPDSACHSP